MRSRKDDLQTLRNRADEIQKRLPRADSKEDIPTEPELIVLLDKWAQIEKQLAAILSLQSASEKQKEMELVPVLSADKVKAECEHLEKMLEAVQKKLNQSDDLNAGDYVNFSRQEDALKVCLKIFFEFSRQEDALKICIDYFFLLYSISSHFYVFPVIFDAIWYFISWFC